MIDIKIPNYQYIMICQSQPFDLKIKYTKNFHKIKSLIKKN